jgi:hypothetical protein
MRPFTTWLAVCLCGLLPFLAPRQVLAAAYATPAVITSAGQSSDVLLAKQMFAKAGVSARVSEKLTADSLKGVKSLVLVLGGSSKGLGQAKGGTDQELARVKALLQKAKAAKIPVMALHIGGESRRGPLSDPFISPVAGQCDQVVVLAGGNKDKLFTRLTQTNRVPLHEAQDYKALVARIGAAWGKEAPAAAKSPAAAKPPAKAPGAGK